VDDIKLARQQVHVKLLVMPSMVEPIILGFDFLCKMGTTIRCGSARLVLTAWPNPDQPTNHQPQTHHDQAATIMDGRPKYKETTSNAKLEAEYYPRQRQSTSRVKGTPTTEAFLKEQLATFALMNGVSNIAQHRFTMRNNRPINQRYSTRNPAMQQIIN